MELFATFTEAADWQLLFNLAFSGLLGALGWYFKTIQTEIRKTQGEVERLHNAHAALIDRMNQQAAGIRQDAVACQRELPSHYVARQEYQQMMKVLREDLSEIKMLLQKKKDKE